MFDLLFLPSTQPDRSISDEVMGLKSYSSVPGAMLYVEHCFTDALPLSLVLGNLYTPLLL